MKTGLACFGLVIVTLITIVVSSIVNGWVLTVLWSWFVTPTFGLAELSIPVAIGISLFIGKLTHEGKPSNNEKKDVSDVIAVVLADAVINPLLVLGMGWIVHSFM